jgi:hydrophobe/amphiphile efflux-1 (HAE1) family protein
MSERQIADTEPTRGAHYYKGISHVAIRRPLGASAIAAVVIVIGAFMSGRLPVNLLPEVVYPLIQLSMNYPGVAPAVMEEQVTRVLERQLASTENLVQLNSTAEEGRSNVNLVFNYGVDLDTALQDASRLLERARAQLPSDIDPPRLRKWDPGATSVFQAGFSSAVRSAREVRDWVDNALAPQLQSIPGVSAVESAGGQIRELEVVLDQQRLAAYGLTLDDVATRLAQENLNIAAGNVTSPGLDMLARTDGRFASPADIGQILLPVPGSARRIRLEDVAEVRDGFREQRVFVRLDGVPATQLTLFKQPDANTVDVVDAVNARLNSLTESGFVPADIQWRPTSDASYFVRGSVAAVASAAFIGGTLAMLVVLAFLGSLRKGLVIGLAIPIAVLATFAMMGLGGLTLNVISLGGLALGVGLLLDNSIVMLENIARHKDRLRKDPETAAHEGAEEVASAIVAGTLTNLAAVIPFLLIVGFAALLFRELILTISFAVVASLAVALTVVPMAAAKLSHLKFRSGMSESRLYLWFDGRIEALADWYERLLLRVLRIRWAVIAAAVAMLAASVMLYDDLGTEFLPQLDDGNLRVNLRLPPGATPEQTDQVARQAEAVLREMPHVESVFSLVGGALFGGVLSERAGRTMIDVTLAPASARPEWPAGRWLVEARRRLEALDIAGARINVRPPQIRGLTFSVAGEDFDLKIVGEDLDLLHDIARRAARLLQDVPGLENVDVNQAERVPQLGISIDRERAAALGVDVSRIGSALRSAVTGAVPTRYSTGQFEYDLRVRLPRDVVDSVDALGSVVVGNAEYGIVRLGEVATLEIEEGPAQIQRENQLRVQRVTGSFNTAVADVGTVMATAQERLGALDTGGATLIYGGQFESIQETQRETMVVIALAIFLVFAVLVVQYERLSNPIVILLTAPFALVGVVAMLWATGTAVSSPALLGMILLIGIVVNNAILLVEYIERGLRRGLDMQTAVVQAGRVRLRPILMTMLTTVSGMLPLAIGMGSGAELMRPLALAVIGGLSVSTFLTLLLAPCLYVIVRRAGDRLVVSLTHRQHHDQLTGPR